jgi:hypothetical protein
LTFTIFFFFFSREGETRDGTGFFSESKLCSTHVKQPKKKTVFFLSVICSRLEAFALMDTVSKDTADYQNRNYLFLLRLRFSMRFWLGSASRVCSGFGFGYGSGSGYST